MSYRYGINLNKQIVPVVWSAFNDQLYTSTSAYSGLQYVAEVNKTAIDYTNTQCTCTDITSYPWNNDSFLTGQFWATLPSYKPYCYIMAALYGTGTNGTDRTAYTQLWNNWT